MEYVTLFATTSLIFLLAYEGWMSKVSSLYCALAALLVVLLEGFNINYKEVYLQFVLIPMAFFIWATVRVWWKILGLVICTTTCLIII